MQDLLAEYTKTDLVSYYNCRRCSLLATLVKYKDQRDRLALASEASASPKEVPSPGRTATKKPSNPFELPPAVATNKTDSPKMTTSRKERRRKVQKLVDKVQDAVDAGDWERDLGEEIKVERSEVAAGKMTRFARVRFCSIRPLYAVDHGLTEKVWTYRRPDSRQTCSRST